MLELKISNLYIYSLVDFEKKSFDKSLFTLKTIHHDYGNNNLAYDSALYDALLCISDTSVQVSISLFSSWLYDQFQQGNITRSFKINERSFLKEELENKQLLNKILEEELKRIQLQNQIEEEKRKNK
jgi:hypothetical protein